MPINDKYPLEEVLSACREYQGNDGSRYITFEYLMLNEINDSHQVFIRLVGRVLGALDLIHADDNVKKVIKAYIWQAESDLKENCQNEGVDNERKIR